MRDERMWVAALVALTVGSVSCGSSKSHDPSLGCTPVDSGSGPSASRSTSSGCAEPAIVGPPTHGGFGTPGSGGITSKLGSGGVAPTGLTDSGFGAGGLVGSGGLGAGGLDPGAGGLLGNGSGGSSP